MKEFYELQKNLRLMFDNLNKMEKSNDKNEAREYLKNFVKYFNLSWEVVSDDCKVDDFLTEYYNIFDSSVVDIDGEDKLDEINYLMETLDQPTDVIYCMSREEIEEKLLG